MRNACVSATAALMGGYVEDPVRLHVKIAPANSIATVIAAVMAVNFDPRGKLRPGERAVVMLLAVDREQAKIAFNYIAALFREIPALAKLVRRTTDDSIELTNGVDVEVHTNSFRSVRGRSLLCVICDECSFWRSEDSANPDREVVAAVQPGLGRIAGSMLILISPHTNAAACSTNDGRTITAATTTAF